MISQILLEYKRAIESRAIDAFWIRRQTGELRSRPESIAQALLATCLKMLFYKMKSGLVVREFGSGVGFVDVGVILSKVLHIIELKVLSKSFRGPAQLEQYMKIEGRSEGWLVIVDARSDKSKRNIPEVIQTRDGRIKTIVIDINPIVPSKRKDSLRKK